MSLSLTDPTFIAFVIFAGGVGKPAVTWVRSRLKVYRETVESHLTEARVLVEESRKALALAQQRGREVDAQVAAMRAHTDHQIDHLRDDHQKHLHLLEVAEEKHLQDLITLTRSHVMAETKRLMLARAIGSVHDHLQVSPLPSRLGH